MSNVRRAPISNFVTRSRVRPTAPRPSPRVTSREDELAQLDTYPYWPLLYPVSVHPLFAIRVLEAAKERLSSNDRLTSRQRLKRQRLNEWRRLCAPVRRDSN